jgi:hypothetical protein
MAGGKEPIPWCSYENPQDIEDGTLCRTPSPAPGPLGTVSNDYNLCGTEHAFPEAMSSLIDNYLLANATFTPAYPYGVPGGRIPLAGRIDPGARRLIGVDRYGDDPKGERVFQLTAGALAAFRGLRSAAIAAGFGGELFTLTSAYRSSKRQATLAEAARLKYGSARAASRWVAQGVSEHITGRAFDLNLGIANNSANAHSGAFEKLPAYQWLKQNAPYFGLTPYAAEPWHWSHNPVDR